MLDGCFLLHCFFLYPLSPTTTSQLSLSVGTLAFILPEAPVTLLLVLFSFVLYGLCVSHVRVPLRVSGGLLGYMQVCSHVFNSCKGTYMLCVCGMCGGYLLLTIAVLKDIVNL